jgi:serine/threonine-protein kinase
VSVTNPFAPESPSFRTGGVLLGKYRIERVLGEGGLGVVVAATHLQLDQRVAIKYLKPTALTQKSAVERFLREARLASQIKSDHVVRVYDVGTVDDGSPYIVMEYLEGFDLAGLLDNGPLPVRTAVDYVLQACEALAEAHAMGIVHRDLKPGNFFLAKRAAGASVVKLIDFGISKGGPGRSPSGSWERLTTGSEVFGTPVYMSPEQLLAAPDVDARTDIWALGVALHELLSGKLPFDGESVPQLCASILADAPVPLRRVRPGAPAELEAVILKCLEKDRKRRFRNVAELAQELAPFAPESAAARVEHIRRVIQEGGASVRPPAPSRASFDPTDEAKASAPTDAPPAPHRRRTLVLAAVASFVATAALGLVLLVSSRQGEHTHATSPAGPSASEPAPAPVAAAPSSSATSEPEAPPHASAAPPSSASAAPSPHPAPRKNVSPPPASAPRRNQEFGERQ